MSEEKALVSLEQKQVIFYDDEITAVLIQQGSKQQVYVPIRPICNRLGIAWPAQRQRILRDPILSEAMTPVIVTITGTGQEVESLCLPLQFLNGWLFGINATRVNSDVRDRLLRYQRECYTILHEAFRAGQLATDIDFNELLNQADPDAVQAYQMAQAIVKLARNQILLESRLTHRLDDHEHRLEDVEATLSNPERFITREQAGRISQAVRAIGLVLTKRTGRNEYGTVYGELTANLISPLTANSRQANMMRPSTGSTPGIRTSPIRTFHSDCSG